MQRSTRWPTDDFAATIGLGAPLSGCWTMVHGRRLFARVAVPSTSGANTPIVMVHGLGVSGRYFLPTARLLGQTFPVIVPDLPGHGRSQNPSHPFDLAEMVDALAGGLDALGVGPAVFVANSLGCQTVVEFVRRQSTRARALVLTGPTGDPSVRPFPRWVIRLARDLPHEPPSLVLLQVLDYSRAGPVRVVRAARVMVTDPFLAKLSAIAQPTLVVRGEHDPIVSQQWVEEIAAALPAGRVVVLPGAAHAVNYSAPLALARVVTTFMTELGLDGPA